jgi:hypothetical protein
MFRVRSRAVLALCLLGSPGLFPPSVRADFPHARPLREDAVNCDLIVYGTLANPREEGDRGSTDLLISDVVKANPILGNAKVLKIPKYLPVTDPKNPPGMLVFCDVFKGEIDPFRGVLAGPAMVGYLKGLLAVHGDDRVRVLWHCARYLEHPDQEVAADAVLEFQLASPKEVTAASCKVPAEKLRAWLADPKTRAERLNLYAFLLGNVGRDADFVLLRDLLERHLKEPTPSPDGILTACVLLRPGEGWTLVRGLLRKPDSDFTVRYTALRTVRYFHSHSDVIGNKDVLDAMRLALAHGDMADLPIEDLRHWHSWELTDAILALRGKPTQPLPVVRRAIVRYALQCPRPEAAAAVAEMRKETPELVADQEELLKLEAESPP